MTLNNSLINFSTEVRDDIVSIADCGGVLIAKRCERVCQQLSISIESLMVRLLPLAAAYSQPNISSFQVGAVALGSSKNDSGFGDLFFGANFEFEQQALCYSVHAEQSAISNAWLHGQQGISSLAVSAPPCGHCRQFLFEVSGKNPFQILLPLDHGSDIFSLSDATEIDKNEADKNQDNSFVFADLSQLLPAAFGPLDLGFEGLMMDLNSTTNKLKLNGSNNDLAKEALQAANLSYAPHSSNFAGCALKLINGKTFSGRYAENAAYNPSLLAFSAVLSQMMLDDSDFDYQNIEQVVLVESSAKASQKNVTQNLLSACAPHVELEYHLASVDPL